MTLQNKVRLTIVFLGLAAYAPALQTGFLYDDHILIEADPAVHSLSGVGIRHDFASGIFDHPDNDVNFYRPLQVFSTQLEYALWQLNPFPYHLTNLCLHIGNILLLNECLLLLGFDLLVAGLAAALFAVHPIIVEDLLMVSGRGELLGVFFMLLSLMFCLRKTRWGLTLGLGAFFLALLSKESAAITPLLLMAVLFYKKEPALSYLAVIPMLAIAALYLALRQHALGALGPPLEAARGTRFLFTAFPTVLLRYARILILPLDLHTDRLLARIGPFWYLRTGLIVLSGLWVFTKGPRWAGFSVIWYVLTFLPKVPLMIAGSFMSDHWAYPALPALVLPLGLFMAHVWNAPPKAARLAARCAAASFLIAGIALTHFNIQTRNTDEKLYRSALHYSASPVMTYNLARLLLREKRPAEALPYFQSLYAGDPRDTNLGRAVAAALWDTGQRTEAIRVLADLLHEVPDDTLTLEMQDQLRRAL